MKEKKSRFIKVTASIMCTAVLFACSNEGGAVKNGSNSEGEAKHSSVTSDKDVAEAIGKKVTYSKEDFYSDWESGDSTSIQLKGTDASFEKESGVMMTDRIITIKTSGVYILSGKLDDGQVIIDAEDKGTVRLVLNGVEINSSTNSPIYVKNAEKTVISLQKGTKNYLSDGAQYVYEDTSTDEPNATLFSKDDLTINGTGKLIVDANYNNGITSKDELRITEGNIQIESADDGLMGRDLLAVKNGTISIKASGDGMKSTNDKDVLKGMIAIENGKFNIEAVNDGIQAETSLLIANGDFTILTGGGSPENIATHEENRGAPRANNMNKNETNTDKNTDKKLDTDIKSNTDTNTESESTKGIKAAVDLKIGGGSFNINSADDAVHSNKMIAITAGDLKIASGDDGIHADESILIKGGNIDITKSYEGIESKAITIADGTIRIKARDDGINIGGGKDGSGMDMEASAEDNLLTINGGHVYVNADGDGLDSNGSISMTAGTVIVSGPTENNNGALDYDKDFKMSGGFLIAAGSVGMVQAVSEESKQNSLLMSYSEKKAAGTVIHLEDSKGNTVVTFAPEKEYQAVFISSPKLLKNMSYTLYTGGKSTGEVKNGLYTNGNYQDGTKVIEFKISDSVTWLNETGITTPKSAGPGPGGVGGDGPQVPPGEVIQAPPGEGTQAPPEKENPSDMFGNLDAETKEKAQTIMEQERAGEITQEEAQKQFKELGIDFPNMGEAGKK